MSFKQFLSEQKARMNSDTENQYAFANGKKPNGRSSWMFAGNKSCDLTKCKAGEDYYQSPANTLYGEAKKEALKWAASKGISELHVLA